MISLRAVLLAAATWAAALSGGCALVSRPNQNGAAESFPPAQLARLSNAEAAELTQGLSPTGYVSNVEADCPVPFDWVMQPLKQGKNYKHQKWISPTGRTAYGVLFTSLPFPAAFVPLAYRQDKTLEGFLREMEKREGRSKLLEREDDDPAHIVRFVAEGSSYRVYVNLIVRGGKAWFVYAGTHLGEPADPLELHKAERARDQTQVGGK